MTKYNWTNKEGVLIFILLCYVVLNERLSALKFRDPVTALDLLYKEVQLQTHTFRVHVHKH